MIGSFWHGLGLDISMATYFSIIPFILILLYALVQLQFFKTVLKFYMYFIVALSSMAYIIELGIYNEWEQKPNYKVFMYLDHPDEIINSNPWVYTIILTLLFIAVMVLFYKRINSFFKTHMLPSSKSYLLTLLFFLLMPGILLLAARGGTSSAVISQSNSYFSQQKLYNDAAVNTVFNLIKTTMKAQSIMDGTNPYKVVLDAGLKKEILTPLLQRDPDCERPSILTTTRPNVVLVLLESWPGDLLKGEQKYLDVVPNFMDFSKDGILFTKTYGSGALSHEGLPSSLSAWPDLFNSDISQLPSKSAQLPSITKSLMQNGYQESIFVYGGQLRYGNLTSYIYSNLFSSIEEYKHIHSIHGEGADGRLGYHDGFMFPYFVEKLNKLKTPFFGATFTLSSHSPYDQPMDPVITWAGKDNEFLNSVYYTDQSIKEFIDLAKKESWYKNTLFIFVADHSHHTPYGWSRNDPRWHHIPMMFYGEVIKPEYRGYRMDKIVSQHDIAATLLSQLNIDHSAYPYSRDVFCKEYKPSAYFSADNGYGMLTPEGYYSYNVVDKRVHKQEGNNTKLLKLQGSLYMENLLDTIISY